MPKLSQLMENDTFIWAGDLYRKDRDLFDTKGNLFRTLAIAIGFQSGKRWVRVRSPHHVRFDPACQVEQVEENFLDRLETVS